MDLAAQQQIKHLHQRGSSEILDAMHIWKECGDRLCEAKRQLESPTEPTQSPHRTKSLDQLASEVNKLDRAGRQSSLLVMEHIRQCRERMEQSRQFYPEIESDLSGFEELIDTMYGGEL